MQIKGVDISGANGNVDFVALKGAGIKFVIMKCGLGSDYPGQQDSRWAENVEKAEKAGTPYGVYHLACARSYAGGVAEAKHALRLIGNHVPLYGVWYDMEEKILLGGDMAAAADGFCSTIEAAGLYAGVYASASWWKNYLTSRVFDRYDKWVAQYNSFCEYGTPGGNVGIWQYTDKLVIGGKNFDGNWAYRDYPALTRKDEAKEEEKVTYEEWLVFQERYQKELAEKSASKWADGAIAYCKENGIMEGRKDGDFDPLSPISRQEAAIVAQRLDQRAQEARNED